VIQFLINKSVAVRHALRNTLRFHLLSGSALVFLCMTPCFSWAEDLNDESNWLDSSWNNMLKTASTGKDDLYLSGYIWHNPNTFSQKELDDFNSDAWGIGWGRRLTDANGDEDSVFVMLFSDSNYDPTPVIGYSRQWIFQSNFPIGLGLGYSLGITSHEDVVNGFPFPYILPLASLRFEKLSIYGTYIPPMNGNPVLGDIAFFFARYEF